MARRGQDRLIIIVTLLVVTIVLVLMLPTHRTAPGQPSPTSIVRQAALPEVAPTILEDKTPEAARFSNSQVPVVASGLIAVPRFRFTGSLADRAAAEACLTAAVLYEAGDDPPGEKAVAQVVLNRVRHPAFPKTVCGVVLQGSERRSGCQFTFTCDGSLARTPSPQGWARARKIAADALDGASFKEVGTATHYHTDWVVPYWRSSLEKIAIVHTQIFYRWPGPWGSRAALGGRLEPGERASDRIAALANLKAQMPSPMAEAAAAQPLPPAQSVTGVPTAALHGNVVRLKDEGGGLYIVQLASNAPSGSYATMAFTLCGGQLECTVYGWASAADVPRSLPVLPWMLQKLAFAYRKSNTLSIAQAYWDCHLYPRPVKAECLAD